ncbi:MAG: hypothetical protein LBO00_10160 [Zoogloeaceae bacterium]|jgi:hypothetical protein|nr:hypothetical protein [Zoogloeaceae bacterium]
MSHLLKNPQEASVLPAQSAALHQACRAHSWSRPFLFLCLLPFCLGASGTHAQNQTRFIGNVFRCVSASGQGVYGDIVPRPCAGRGYSIHSGKSGLLLRRIAPPLSKEEKEQLAAERMQKEQEYQALLAYRQRRQAIFSTYANLAELERQQSEVETPLKQEIASAGQRIDAARQRLSFAQGIVKRYKDKIPADLVKSMRNDDLEIKFQTEFIKLRQQELDKAKKKFEEDRKLYREGAGR